uniref:Uncharacterized protein n=1 Tax=Chromera velia CCMP2878 TaxID=1169474 RepID=A0A0G4I9P8_9ALVE|eukprot:Cvel_12324.t1-p1 / transcript=Cvel_12324.t1 / gene=Cvel_12324 / organism=Chromera_velia_CCMP2878 / gene_product=hypothetical protein / transcript_product=hypothetical protein / location=Cvel_scaffold801:53160-60475(+) / protein_length=457 / sequence_SO=supercontig / SO=protein_coding / is_pseudo=false
MPPSDLDRDFGETLKGERKGGKAKEGLLSGIVQGLFRRISGPPKNDQRSLGEKGEGENAPLLPDSFFQSNKGLADHDLDKGMREVEELTGLGASGGGEKLAAVAGKGASMFDTHEALKTNIAVALKGADVKVTDKREKSKCGSAVGKARDDLISGIQHDCQTTEIDLTGLKGAYNEVKHVSEEHFGLYGEEEGVPNPSDIASLKRDADRLSGLVCGSDATCAQSEEQFRAWMEARKTLFRTPTAEFDPVSRGPRAGKVPREFSDYTFSYPEKVGGGSVSGFVQEEPSISSSSPQDNQQGPEEAAENGLSSSSTQISSQTSEGEGRDNQPAETQEDRERTRQQHQALVQTLSSAQQQMKDLKMHQKIISKRERDSTSAHSPPPVSVLPSEEEAQLIQSFAQNSGAPLAPSSPTDREEAEERLEPSNSQSGNAEEQRGGPGLLESIVSPHLFDSLSESA